MQIIVSIGDGSSVASYSENSEEAIDAAVENVRDFLTHFPEENLTVRVIS